VEEEMKTRTVYYILGVIISLLALTSIGGLSVYAYSSNNDLQATREQLHGLQETYDQLKADHADLNNKYNQASTDLKVANDKIASLEGELKTAKEQNQKFEQTIKMTKLNMKVLDGLFDESVSLQDMEARIAAIGNDELTAKWGAITNQDELGGFIVYLVHSIWQSLN
jgi:septal ring factor EnvC (AmiA/AmiB activator)